MPLLAAMPPLPVLLSLAFLLTLLLLFAAAAAVAATEYAAASPAHCGTRACCAGAYVTILASEPLRERTRLLEEGKSRKLVMRNATLDHVQGSTILRRDLEACMRARPYGSVLVLSSEADEGVAALGSPSVASDSRSLTTLLLVRDIRRAMLEEETARAMLPADGEKPTDTSPPVPPARPMRRISRENPTAVALYSRGWLLPDGLPPQAGPSGSKVAPDDDFTLLGEILDSETRDLVATAGVSDYIMSNKLISKVIAMVAEQPAVCPLFETLFAEEGDELYVRDARHYCTPGEVLSFWQMALRAREAGDTAIGFKRGEALVELNPPEKQAPLEWRLGDFLVVLGDH